MSASETYFVAATTVTPSPTCACTSARRSRMRSGDGTHDSLRSALAPAAPVREEELGMAARAEIRALDLADAGAPQRPLRRRPEVEVAPHGQILVEEGRHLHTDLVAARADRRPDDRRGL